MPLGLAHGSPLTSFPGLTGVILRRHGGLRVSSDAVLFMPHFSEAALCPPESVREPPSACVVPLCTLGARGSQRRRGCETLLCGARGRVWSGQQCQSRRTTRRPACLLAGHCLPSGGRGVKGSEWKEEVRLRNCSLSTCPVPGHRGLSVSRKVQFPPVRSVPSAGRAQMLNEGMTWQMTVMRPCRGLTWPSGQ